MRLTSVRERSACRQGMLPGPAASRCPEGEGSGRQKNRAEERLTEGEQQWCQLLSALPAFAHEVAGALLGLPCEDTQCL